MNTCGRGLTHGFPQTACAIGLSRPHGRHTEGVRIAILGGGPAGYEAALVAVELGAQVTLVERDGIGGACVLTDCVPSKALVSTAEVRTSVNGADALGIACT